MKLRTSTWALGSVLLCLPLLTVGLCSQRLGDPVGDLLDPQGNPTTGEPYLDIVEAEVFFEGSSCIFWINVSGPIPASVPASIFVEYDLLVDIDRNRSTRPWGNWALIDAGLGVDVLARVTLSSDGLAGEVITWPEGRSSTDATDFEVDGNVAELRFDTSKLGETSDVDYVVAVRDYVDNYFAIVDRCPNEGHAWTAVEKGVDGDSAWPAVGIASAVSVVAAAFVLGFLIRRRKG